MKPLNCNQMFMSLRDKQHNVMIKVYHNIVKEIILNTK